MFSGNPEKQDKRIRRGPQATYPESRLHSVLTDFSQEYSMSKSPEEAKVTTCRRKKLNKQKVASTASIPSWHFNPVNNSGTNEKQTHKYKSKILNDQANKQYQPLIVIQAQKYMPKTPSNTNSSDTKELSEISKVLPFPIKDIKAEDINKTATVILKAAQSNRTKLQRFDDPNTLVGDNTKDKDIYDLFVKLLATTFKVYNVQSEFKSDNIQSNNIMEIDEHVATKLNVKKNVEKADALNGLRTTDQFFNITDEDIYTWNDQRIQVMQKQPLYKNLEPPLAKVPKRKKLYSTSFSHAPRTDVLSSRLERTVSDQKPRKKRFKNFRNVLLDTLKEDLKMDKDDFEEPQNMHEALRIMAKNKLKCRTQIRLDKGVKFKKIGDGTDTDCQFKRKRVISATTEARKSKKLKKGFGKTKPSAPFESRNNIHSKIIKTPVNPNTELDEYKADEFPNRPSIQSIEVKGFDFDSNITTQLPDLRWTENPYSNNTFHRLRQEDSSRYYLKTAPDRKVSSLETKRDEDNVHIRHEITKGPSTKILTKRLQFDNDSVGDESLSLETGSDCSLSEHSDSLSKLMTHENIEFLNKMFN